MKERIQGFFIFQVAGFLCLLGPKKAKKYFWDKAVSKAVIQLAKEIRLKKLAEQNTKEVLILNDIIENHKGLIAERD